MKRKSSSLDDITLRFESGSRSACSSLLRMSSPVFDAMLESGMKEQEQKTIDVTIASKDDFDLFYDLLQPGAGLVGKKKIVEKNVDALLTLAKYYQVSFLQRACEEVLLSLPASVQRLLQAKEHGLARQQSRCIGALAESCTKKDLKMIHEASPDLVLRLAYTMRGYSEEEGEGEEEGEEEEEEGFVNDPVVTIP